MKYQVFEYQQRGGQAARVYSKMCIDYISPTRRRERDGTSSTSAFGLKLLVYLALSC